MHSVLERNSDHKQPNLYVLSQRDNSNDDNNDDDNNDDDDDDDNDDDDGDSSGSLSLKQSTHIIILDAQIDMY